MHWGGVVPWENARKAIYADNGETSRMVPENGRHVVMPGETVSGLAELYHVGMVDLVALNGLSAPYTIYVGQVLRLPRPGETAIAARNPARGAPVQAASAPPSGGPTHTVVRGDSLARIAAANRVGLGDVIALNPGIDPDRLMVGTRVRLPGGSGPQTAVAARAAPASDRTVAAAPAARPQVVPVATRPAAPAAAEQAARQRDLAAVAAPALSGAGFIWPLESGTVISRFGSKPDGRQNDGINIAAPAGSLVRATENGLVVYAGEDLAAFGRMLLVRHADGYLSAYAHNDTLLVARGDVVQRGQPLAKVGTSGEVVEPQLHFEIRRGKAPIDPLKMLRDGSVEIAQRSE
ncbi:MAG: M23 family metallopeptidase [Geminicoccaceae bacterium]|nr:M23 family metallopeptidase [Geminicoccaceae bacterium]HRY25148.1 M23 family metallopeptidase [Geminicoccaceae bacterium]